MIHGVVVLAAQGQAAALIVNAAVSAPPAAETVSPATGSDDVQPFACVTASGCPPTVKFAVRARPGFALKA